MRLIKNRLAASLVEMSGTAKDEVIQYLTKLAEIENATNNRAELQEDLDKNWRASNLRAEWYCVITNMVNKHPYLCLAGSFLIIYQVLWGALLLLRKIL